MRTNLDMNNNKIHNLINNINNDGVVNKGNIDSADQNNKINTKADKSYVDNNITNVVLDITKTEDKTKKYVDESHITSGNNLKDELRYLMEDIDDSSSEASISVTGIIDLALIHHIHLIKNVWSMKLGKNAQNNYA